jgi:hypothetical protein
LSFDYSQENLKGIIEYLQEALRSGLGSRVLPSSLILEVVIDLLLKVRNNLEEGKPFWPKGNPHLVNLGGINELNNENLVKVQEPTKSLPDVEAVISYLNHLTVDLISLKKSGRVPAILGWVASTSKKLSPQEYHYWQRRRRRREAGP